MRRQAAAQALALACIVPGPLVHISLYHDSQDFCGDFTEMSAVGFNQMRLPCGVTYRTQPATSGPGNESFVLVYHNHEHSNTTIQR